MGRIFHVNFRLGNIFLQSMQINSHICASITICHTNPACSVQPAGITDIHARPRVGFGNLSIDNSKLSLTQ